MITSTKSNPKGVTPPRFVRLLLTVLGFGLITPRGAAQAGGPGGPGGPPEGDSSFAINDVSASYSFSSDADIEKSGKLGSVEISHYEFAASASLPAPRTWRLSSEISWSRDEFDLTGPVPLPEELESIGLNFMAMKDLSLEIGPGWSAMAMLNPGFSSDSGEISADSFNLLMIVAIGKEVSPNLSWNLGVVGMTRGQTKVLPMIGVDWSFAPDWKLSVGFPRTAVYYQFNEALSLNAGVTFHGGTYYISEAPAAGLGDTYLDYQEIRAGFGAEYQISKRFSVVIDGGMTIERSFDYYDRNVELDGKSAAYGRLGVRCQF